MKRKTRSRRYIDCVRWIAANDAPLEMGPVAIARRPTARLVAAVFGVPPLVVGVDVMNIRKEGICLE